MKMVLNFTVQWDLFQLLLKCFWGITFLICISHKASYNYNLRAEHVKFITWVQPRETLSCSSVNK